MYLKSSRRFKTRHQNAFQNASSKRVIVVYLKWPRRRREKKLYRKTYRASYPRIRALSLAQGVHRKTYRASYPRIRALSLAQGVHRKTYRARSPRIRALSLVRGEMVSPGAERARAKKVAKEQREEEEEEKEEEEKWERAGCSVLKNRTSHKG